MERFFSPFGPNQKEIILEEEELHHLKVLRIAEGEEVEIINGKGYLAKASLRKGGRFDVSSIAYFPPPFKITLIQGLTRPNHLDFIVEKTVELGISEIILFKSDRSEKKSINIERLTRIAISAIKQSKRYYLPKMALINSLKDYSTKDVLLFGSLSREAKPLFEICKDIARPVTYLIGPEKGFSDEEITYLKSLHAVEAKLSNFTLRAETAAIAFLSILENILGEKL